MDVTIAKTNGRRLAIWSALIGILIAYVLFGWIVYSWDKNVSEAIFWIFDVEFWYHLVIGTIGLLAMAYFFGQLAGVEILVKRKNEFLVGVKYGFIILLTGTLIGSTVGFVQEGIDDIGGFSNPFYDYYFKPVYWVMMFGTIPTILIGLWFGWQIKRIGNGEQGERDVK